MTNDELRMVTRLRAALELAMEYWVDPPDDVRERCEAALLEPVPDADDD
jgi:hypothetical protein